MLMWDQPAHLFAAKTLLQININFLLGFNLPLSCHEIQIRLQKGYEPYCVEVVHKGYRNSLCHLSWAACREVVRFNKLFG